MTAQRPGPELLLCTGQREPGCKSYRGAAATAGERRGREGCERARSCVSEPLLLPAIATPAWLFPSRVWLGGVPEGCLLGSLHGQVARDQRAPDPRVIAALPSSLPSAERAVAPRTLGELETSLRAAQELGRWSWGASGHQLKRGVEAGTGEGGDRTASSWGAPARSGSRVWAGGRCG